MIHFTEFILYVSDQKQSKEFYSAILGLKPVLDVNGMTEFLVAANVKLGIMPTENIVRILGNKTPHPESGNGVPRCELYLYVDSAEKYYSRAKDNGAIEISPVQMRDWGDTAGYLSDPDGHVIAFAEKPNTIF